MVGVLISSVPNGNIKCDSIRDIILAANKNVPVGGNIDDSIGGYTFDSIGVNSDRLFAM